MIAGALAFRPIRAGPVTKLTKPTTLTQAGTLILRSGIPAFKEGSLYIPTSAENELSYIMVQA